MEHISVIATISHPLRRRMLGHLLLHGATQVGTFARALDAQVGSISHHLRMLQRAGIVEQTDAPDGDRRASWWQLARRSFTWSTSDYDSPADALLAREAQRANVRHQLDLLQRWHRASVHSDREGFSTDSLAWATQEELSDLHARLNALLDEWRRGIDREDGRERMPVFFFAHGFPAEV
ncbi:ArsR/SmtB family transcription factor [Microbacterium sp. NPDC058342]|uniref:ArsR/SmtB family transcription factor n=1 Tax=Microbacterium sp. NPDC058342 TaxID=3346454 RepID=UPI00365A07E2